MGLDLRTPIGLLFTIVGLLLAGYGLYTHGSDMYARSLGMNVNLWWGAVLVVFGLSMLWLSRRKARPTRDSARLASLVKPPSDIDRG